MNFIKHFLTITKPYALALWALAKAHSETLRAFVARHPKHVTAALAVVLLGGGGGAFAVANLGPDASNLPVRMLVETLETPNLDQQVAALEQKNPQALSQRHHPRHRHRRKSAAPCGTCRFSGCRLHP